jgi:hypothetical protein
MDEYSDTDSFRLEPFMRPVIINENLLTVACMRVGTSLQRRCSRELLVPLQLGGWVGEMRCAYAFFNRIVRVLCVRRL